MKKIKAALCAVAAALFLTASVCAEPATEPIYIWNGESSFSTACDYSVRTALEITENLEIPEGMTLYIRSDGCLTISENATLTIRGELKINSGGTLRCYGNIENYGELNDYGYAIARENTELKSVGRLNVFTGGVLNVLGNSEITTMYINGSAYFRENSALNLNGELRVGENGFLRTCNDLSVSENALIRNFGCIDLPEACNAKLDGTFENRAAVTGNGSVSISRFLSLKDNGTEFEPTVIKPKVRQVDGAYYFGEILIVNRQYPLPADYPIEELNADAYASLMQMRVDSGYPMTIMSGYRSYQYQITTYNHWKNLYGQASADKISAPPGASEHQSGLAIDISYLSTAYDNTAEGEWIAENAHKYGFIVRFPKDQDAYTGYSYEPWHIRYLGVELATMVYESGMSLEEFVGLPPIESNPAA